VKARHVDCQDSRTSAQYRRHGQTLSSLEPDLVISSWSKAVTVNVDRIITSS
jgi:hypothetical protein